MASEGRVAWWGGGRTSAEHRRERLRREARGGGKQDGEGEEKAGLQARAGGGEARAEGARPCRARREAQRFPHHFFSGRRNAGRKWRSGFGQPLEAGPPAEGVARIRARTGIPDAGLRFGFARRPSCARCSAAGCMVAGRGARRIPFRKAQRRSLPASAMFCLRWSAAFSAGTAQGCRRGIVRPLRGQRGINQNMPSAMFFTSISPSSPMNTS